MPYSKELGLLQDTLKKCRVSSNLVLPTEPISTAMDFCIKDIIKGGFEVTPSVQAYIGSLDKNTVYRYIDEFGLGYLYLKLTDEFGGPLLFIGPYLSSAVGEQELLELGESTGAPPKAQKYLEEYFSGITVLSDGSPVFLMIDTFCERIWGQSGFSVCDVNDTGGSEGVIPPLASAPSSDTFDDALLNIKNMETRYSLENELIDAVKRGQLHKEKLLFGAISDKMFEKRVQDPLRNLKNYAIIMNTLLRKAAEQGGVHPVYIDKTSSDIAINIEQAPSVSQITQLMREIFRAYCRLVRKHSIQMYSIAVQKTMLIVDADLSADLSLSSIAKQQNISPAYLSSLFKKETGKNVSEYIREKRMAYASHLLSTTHLQVQTVALHCGIMDVQYFSKIFKKYTGKTPKEYRETAN